MSPPSAKIGKAKNAAVALAIRSAADPAWARRGFARLAAVRAGGLVSLAAPHARVLAALFSGSPAMSEWVYKNPEWAEHLTPAALEHPRQKQGLWREINRFLPAAQTAKDWDGALLQLRRFRQQEMVRIAARDLARFGNAPQVTREIADVADVCLETVWRICDQRLTARLGTPWHQDADEEWRRTEFAVLGLGKLGGQELNYSSDVDVIFVYSEEGQVFKETPRGRRIPASALTSHQFYKRLAEAWIAEVTRQGPEGMLYRVDARLRPEGDAGPLVRSLDSYEAFYAQCGQIWERMMLIKARGVAGSVSLAGEFLEMLQPFRYPRSLDESALREIATMKTRMEEEVVKAGELDRNVKLGRGGIREIEFIAQTSQILHAGRIPFLQGPQTLPVVEKLARYERLELSEAKALAEAYCFLRDVEHRLQMENDLQTHTIPKESGALLRLGRLMGFRNAAQFETKRAYHTQLVRRSYDRLLRADASPVPAAFPPFSKETEWKALLHAHGFQDVEASLRRVTEFAQGPGYVLTSQRTTDLALRILPRFLALCPTPENLRRLTPVTATTAAEKIRVLSDPDRVMARLDSFVGSYGARAPLFELWSHNPSLFELLLLLFDRSEFLAEIAIRTPDLVDELMLGDRLRRRKTAAEILAELRLGASDPDQRLWLRRYHQSEFMRIGLRDILGLTDFEQNSSELTALAEACLQYAVELVLRANRCPAASLTVIGLGKFGGQELDYGSDLDIVYVASSQAKNLPKLQKVAAEVGDLLSSQTELGIAFTTDVRLRPDGEKGSLVQSLDTCRNYYRRRAQLWEIQTLTRARGVAGNAALGEEFLRMIAEFVPWGNPGPEVRSLAAYAPDWKSKIAQMRARIESERTVPGQDALAFKTGVGGLIDVEFLAQASALEQGWHEPNTLRALERARDAGVFSADEGTALLASYRRLRRIESILRRWSFVGEATMPDDPPAFRRVSIRCGFSSPEAFRDAMAADRQVIREIYQRLLGP